MARPSASIWAGGPTYLEPQPGVSVPGLHAVDMSSLGYQLNPFPYGTNPGGVAQPAGGGASWSVSGTPTVTGTPSLGPPPAGGVNPGGPIRAIRTSYGFTPGSFPGGVVNPGGPMRTAVGPVNPGGPIRRV